MIVKKQKCDESFGGIDGKRTCDTECPWYLEEFICACSVEASENPAACLKIVREEKEER